MTVCCRINIKISMTVQRGMCKQVEHGWHEVANHTKKKYIKNKIRYDIKTQKVLCANVQMSKWHWQYEVESNECVISDLK